MRPDEGRTRHRPAPVVADWLDARVAIDLVSGKWAPGVIEVLFTGPRRHLDLLTDVSGVSERMLTYTLRRLVRDGLVTQCLIREQQGSVPGYALTPLGRSIREPIAGMRNWIRAHRDQLPARRQRQLVRRL